MKTIYFIFSPCDWVNYTHCFFVVSNKKENRSYPWICPNAYYYVFHPQTMATQRSEMLSERFRCKVCMIVFTIVFISAAHPYTKRIDEIQKFLLENFLITAATRTRMTERHNFKERMCKLKSFGWKFGVWRDKDKAPTQKRRNGK